MTCRTGCRFWSRIRDKCPASYFYSTVCSILNRRRSRSRFMFEVYFTNWTAVGCCHSLLADVRSTVFVPEWRSGS